MVNKFKKKINSNHPQTLKYKWHKICEKLRKLISTEILIQNLKLLWTCTSLTKVTKSTRLKILLRVKTLQHVEEAIVAGFGCHKFTTHTVGASNSITCSNLGTRLSGRSASSVILISPKNFSSKCLLFLANKNNCTTVTSWKYLLKQKIQKFQARQYKLFIIQNP